VLATFFDAYRDRFLAAYHGEQATAGDQPLDESARNALLSIAEIRVSEAKAAELRERLREVIGELAEPAARDRGSVLVNAMIAFYTVTVPDNGELTASQDRGSGT
jgi:hypothetical protein